MQAEAKGALMLKAKLAGWLIMLTIVGAAPAQAQIGLLQTPGLPDLPALPSAAGDPFPMVGRLDRLGRTVEDTLQAPARLTGLIRRSNGVLEADPLGWPVVSSEILAIDLSAAGFQRALDAGFTLVRRERLEALNIETVVLAPPRRMSLVRGVERLRRLNPDAEITFNHIHSPAGDFGVSPGQGAAAVSTRPGPAPRLGLIDTGVEATHPALDGSSLLQRGFAGPARSGAHGTAVASLLIGRSGDFAGAFPGGGLMVADLYGGRPTGGSSTNLAQALAWMAEQRVSVVNISLVGPRNALVARAVERAQAGGMLIVAAVGNDGPAAPPLYPAAYEGVIGVTGVTAGNGVLPEAGRGPHVDFAAPGADMAAAAQDGGWTRVRGTSFAAPLVAGLLASSGGGADGLRAVGRAATDLGEPGPDGVYGQGLVGERLRIAPAAVGARGRLRR